MDTEKKLEELVKKGVVSHVDLVNTRKYDENAYFEGNKVTLFILGKIGCAYSDFKETYPNATCREKDLAKNLHPRQCDCGDDCDTCTACGEDSPLNHPIPNMYALIYDGKNTQTYNLKFVEIVQDQPVFEFKLSTSEEIADLIEKGLSNPHQGCQGCPSSGNCDKEE